MTQPTIRELRKRLGLTQQQVAEICGFNPSYISQIESGRRKMTQRTERIIFAELKKMLDDGVPIQAGTINAQVVGGLHNVAHFVGREDNPQNGYELLEKKLITVLEDISDVKSLLVKILAKIG